MRIQSAGAELLVALLARRGAESAQAVIFGVEHRDAGGARGRLRADAAGPVTLVDGNNH
jgi:hypothetical protein